MAADAGLNKNPLACEKFGSGHTIFPFSTADKID